MYDMETNIPCVIRTNNKNLRQKLDDLGYLWWCITDSDSGIATMKYNFSAQSSACPNVEELIYVGLESEEDIEDYIQEGWYDCGTDETLFLALSSLGRNVYHGDWFTNRDCSLWILSNDDLEGFHKAIPEELIKLFGGCQ